MTVSSRATPDFTGVIRGKNGGQESIDADANPTSDPEGSAYEPGGGGGDLRVLGHHGEEISRKFRGDQTRFRPQNRYGLAATTGFSCQFSLFPGLDEAGRVLHVIQTLNVAAEQKMYACREGAHLRSHPDHDEVPLIMTS